MDNSFISYKLQVRSVWFATNDSPYNFGVSYQSSFYCVDNCLCRYFVIIHANWFIYASTSYPIASYRFIINDVNLHCYLVVYLCFYCFIICVTTVHSFPPFSVMFTLQK